MLNLKKNVRTARYQLDLRVDRHALQRAERLQQAREGLDLHGCERDQRQHARELRELLENGLLPVVSGALHGGFGRDERELAGALDDGVLGDGGQNEHAVVEGCELLESVGEMGIGIVLEKEGLEVVLNGRRTAKQLDHCLDPHVRSRGSTTTIGVIITIVVVLVGLRKTQHGR